MHFAGMIFEDPEKEARDRGTQIPLHRDLARSPQPDSPNPKYDEQAAAAYAQAKEQAEAFCREKGGRARRR